MEEPEKILERIMNFEQQYTPKFTNLIKQSLIDNVSLDIDDDPDGDILPNLPDSKPIHSTSHSDEQYLNKHPSQSPLSTFTMIEKTRPNLESHAMSLSQPLPNAMPSYQDNKKTHHQHKQTPIMARPGNNSSNHIKLINQNAFLITSDVQYNSDEDEDGDHFITKPLNDDDDDNNDSNGSGSVRRYSSDEDDDGNDEPLDPLIEEYDAVSHEIHKSKLRLRKLDRQMTIAQRQGTSQSDLVKQHSDIKIKIAQLISKRRQLESHDVVRKYIKEEDTPTVELDVSGANEVIDNEKQKFMDDGGLMEINEDEEEEDEEQEIKNNNISPTVTTNESSNHTSDSDVNTDDDALRGYLNGLGGINGYKDDQSRSAGSIMNDFDYSYDAEVVVKEEEYGNNDDDGPTGSVKLHSSDDEENDDDDDGGGSVQYNSDPEDEEEDESDGGGSMQMNAEMNNDENWVNEEEESGGYEDEDESGGGSVQMNDDIEQEENWVDEDFDTKSIEYRDSDDENEEEIDIKTKENEDEDHDEDEETKQDDIDDIDDIDDKNEESKDNDEDDIDDNNDNNDNNDDNDDNDDNNNDNNNDDNDNDNDGVKNEEEEKEYDEDKEEEIDGVYMSNIIRGDGSGSGRRRRLEQMKRVRNYKEYGHDNGDNDDLGGLKRKYQDRRRHREQIEIHQGFSMDDLIKPSDSDQEDEEFNDKNQIEAAMMDFTKQYQTNQEIYDEEKDEENNNNDIDPDRNDMDYDGYRVDDEDDHNQTPILPQKKKSVLLDINQFSVNLAAVIEEENTEDDDDDEKYFQTVEYQTDSDCDSNDSVVVKKEILKNVTVNDLQKFDTV